MNLSSQTWPTESRVVLANKIPGYHAVEDPELAHSVQLHLIVRLRVVRGVGQVDSGLVALVEHDPVSVIESVGYGHQRLIDVGHLEDDALSLSLVRLELQADLPDIGNSVIVAVT